MTTNKVATHTAPARVASVKPAPAITEKPAPEAVSPVAFPPKTFQQLKKLSEEGLDYQEVSQNKGFGKRKLIIIRFRRCQPWQQVATLLKALTKYDDTAYDTIIIQGVYNQETNIYEYTNGQLTFDRNVRLGSQMQNRYRIETDNGYSAESQRIVITE